MIAGKERPERNYMMKLYDEIIKELNRLLGNYETGRVTKTVESDCFAWDSLEGQFFLNSDALIELGGGSLPAVSGTLYTCPEGPTEENTAGGENTAGAGAGPTGENAAGADAGRTGENAAGAGAGRTGENAAEAGADRTARESAMAGEKRVTLYGPDLPALQGDRPYARVTLVRLRKEFAAEEHKLYNLLRSIEYIRYHVNPRGYMPRISTVQSREQVRVSRDAVSEGLDFYKAGRVYEEAYLKHPAVEAAETVFITLNQFDYRALQNLLNRAEDITMSLDHPLNHLKMDCGSCSLKPVCDEVEALCTKTEAR